MTDMLASLSKDIGVVLFCNTSLAGEDTKAYTNVFKALWERAESLTPPRPSPARQGSE